MRDIKLFPKIEDDNNDEHEDVDEGQDNNYEVENQDNVLDQESQQCSVEYYMDFKDEDDDDDGDNYIKFSCGDRNLANDIIEMEFELTDSEENDTGQNIKNQDADANNDNDDTRIVENINSPRILQAEPTQLILQENGRPKRQSRVKAEVLLQKQLENGNKCGEKFDIDSDKDSEDCDFDQNHSDLSSDDDEIENSER
jgi:hypothetical protein